MRKSLLNGLALLLISISPMVSGFAGCSKPSLEAKSQVEVQQIEVPKNGEASKEEYLPKEEYDKIKRELDLKLKQNEEYEKAFSKWKKENFRWNIEEAIGLARLARNNVVIEKLNAKISEEELRVLKYERALRKLGLDPYEIEKNGIEDKEYPLRVEKEKRERDRMVWERDRAFYEKEIARWQKRAYELEKEKYAIPESR